MIISNLNHLEAVTEETEIQGGSGKKYPKYYGKKSKKPTAVANADAYADAFGYRYAKADTDTYAIASSFFGNSAVSGSSSYAAAA